MDLIEGVFNGIQSISRIVGQQQISRPVLGENTAHSLQKRIEECNNILRDLVDGDLKKHSEMVDLDKAFHQEITKLQAEIQQRRKSQGELLALYQCEDSSVEEEITSMEKDIAALDEEKVQIQSAIHQSGSQINVLATECASIENSIEEDFKELNLLTNKLAKQEENSTKMESFGSDVKFFDDQFRLAEQTLALMKREEREVETEYDDLLLKEKELERQVSREREKKLDLQRQKMQQMHLFYCELKRKDQEKHTSSSGLHTEVKKTLEAKGFKRPSKR